MPQGDISASKTIPVACPILAIEIGTVIEEIRHASGAQVTQLEQLLGSLQATYEKQCEGKRAEDLAKTVKVTASVQLVDGNLLVNLIQTKGDVVHVIIGGNDGTLVTIDSKGVVTVLPPEGPGDPELRQAVSAISTSLQTLIGGAAVTASA